MNKVTNYLKKHWIMSAIVFSVLGSLIAIPLISPTSNALRLINNILAKARLLDIIYFVFVIIIFITLYRLYKRLSGLNENKFKDLLASNQSMQSHKEQLINQMNDLIVGYNKLSDEDRQLINSIKPFVDRLKDIKSEFANNAMWIKYPSSDSWDGPFCSTCFEAKGLQIHLLKSRGPGVFACRNCQRSVVCSGPPANK